MYCYYLTKVKTVFQNAVKLFLCYERDEESTNDKSISQINKPSNTASVGCICLLNETINTSLIYFKDQEVIIR